MANQEIYHTKVEFHAPRVLLYCKILYFLSSRTKGNNLLRFPDKKIFWPAWYSLASANGLDYKIVRKNFFATAIAKSLICWSHLDIIRSILLCTVVWVTLMYSDLKMKMHLIEESREHAAPYSAMSSGWWCDYPEFSWPFKKRNIVLFAKNFRPISYIEFFLPKDKAWMEQRKLQNTVPSDKR